MLPDSELMSRQTKEHFSPKIWSLCSFAGFSSEGRQRFMLGETNKPGWAPEGAPTRPLFNPPALHLTWLGTEISPRSGFMSSHTSGEP